MLLSDREYAELARLAEAVQAATRDCVLKQDQVLALRKQTDEAEVALQDAERTKASAQRALVTLIKVVK